MQRNFVPIVLGLLDILSTSVSALLAVSIYSNFKIESVYFAPVIYQLPVLACIIVLGALGMHLYRRVWRYAGIKELISVVSTVVVAVCLWYGYSWVINIKLPLTIYVLTALFLMVGMGSIRLTSRLRAHYKLTIYSGEKTTQRVLIIGAGDAGAMIAREIEHYHVGKQRVIGFIDDDVNKKSCRIIGAKVIGNRNDIERIVIENEIDEIIIAIPSAPIADQRDIARICKKTKVPTKILPGLYEIINGKVNLSHLRDIEIEDLLGREPVKLDDEAVFNHTKDKVCLITGAGGSIGSEICRQLMLTGPKQLLLLGKGENSIYLIHRELQQMYPDAILTPIIADVRDRERIREILEKDKPQVVFHAAAHKHVPLMEYQPIEAVKNNVLGTKIMAEEVDRLGCESFVMISTDKAVNPTSVMGCTKRVAEMFVQSMNAQSKTRFVVVRFGNVLGSRGSVVPLFKKQVAMGGPITVTHKDMKRYFMTIPEASRLVLKAGAMATGGEVFVLDMGEPVYISELAKSIITLSGLEPDVDIEIKYTGLRPGEKLFEELLSAEDGTEQTKHKKIFTARIKETTKEQIDAYVELLLSDDDDDVVVRHLQKVVPNYNPNR